MFDLFKIEDVNAKASRLDPAKLNWINQHYLKTDAPSDVAKHLVWHLQNAGYDLNRGPKPEDVVIALRDRVHTLKEMAEKAKCWFCPLTDADKETNRRKSSIRAKVEHPFLILKRLWGFAKVRYRGLAKNAAQLLTLVGLANLILAKR